MSHRDIDCNNPGLWPRWATRRIAVASQRDARHEALAASKYPLTPSEQAELDKHNADRAQRIDGVTKP